MLYKQRDSGCRGCGQVFSRLYRDASSKQEAAECGPELSMAFVFLREGFGTVGTRQGAEGSFRSLNAGRRPKHAPEPSSALDLALRRGFGKSSTGDLRALSSAPLKQKAFVALLGD